MMPTLLIILLGSILLTPTTQQCSGNNSKETCLKDLQANNDDLRIKRLSALVATAIGAGIFLPLTALLYHNTKFCLIELKKLKNSEGTNLSKTPAFLTLSSLLVVGLVTIPPKSLGATHLVLGGLNLFYETL